MDNASKLGDNNMATNQKPIILCAGGNGRALVYGYVVDLPKPGEPVRLERARMVISYRGGGLFRVASVGPRGDDMITHAVPSTLETVWQEYLECTPEAAEAFDAWKGAE